AKAAAPSALASSPKSSRDRFPIVIERAAFGRPFCFSGCKFFSARGKAAYTGRDFPVPLS
ncbi:MAG: hypothetical protein QM656_16445, partial [Paracoccaceae bacterium]